MTTTQPARSAKSGRGVLARPLDALVFLLPMIIFYEVMAAGRPERLIAFQWMWNFLEMFGRVSLWAPGLAVIIILITTHAASGEQWRVHWRHVGYMYVEAIALALPLLLMSWLIPLAAGAGGGSLLEQLALWVGAGIYEELIFRLILISLVVIIGVDVIKLPLKPVAIAAVCLSALAFAAHHHHPIGSEPFHVKSFVFRSLAGAYLATVFWYRGYGSAAGCHAAYNVGLMFLNH